MNNRPHKKEKAKKRSKEYFVKTAAQVIHYTDNTVHSETSKTESNLMDLCHYTKRIGVCQAYVCCFVAVYTAKRRNCTIIIRYVKVESMKRIMRLDNIGSW